MSLESTPTPFTRGDVQIAATDPGVRDVHGQPARARLGHRGSSDANDTAAFPHQRILLSHRIGPPSPREFSLRVTYLHVAVVGTAATCT